MRFEKLAAGAALLMLAGCAVDDPDNAPLYGDWELVRSIDSVTLDGTVFSPEQVPAGVLQFSESEQICGEPMYTDRDWQVQDLSEQTNGACTLDGYTFDADSADYSGSCRIEEDGVTFTPTIRGRSTFSEQSHRDVITMEGTIALEGDNSPHVMKIIMVQEGTRTGDC